MRLTKDNQIEFYKYSITNSRDFHRTSCEDMGIVFKDDFKLTNENICDASDPKYPKWFVGAKINIADSVLQSAKTNPEKIAIIYEDELGKSKVITYRQLDELSNKFANGLKERGIEKGDHIVLCTANMNPESIAAYIGAMKIGAISVCLLPRAEEIELRSKLEQLPEKPKLIITQDHCDKNINKPFPLYTKLRDLNIAPAVVIMDDALKPVELKKGDSAFTGFIDNKPTRFESVALSPEDVISVLFSSGTTGSPKAIPWRADSFIKSANDGRLNYLMNKDDILCWPSNLGWMMGSFDIASAFMNNATLAVYEGDPKSKTFAKFVEKNRITKLGGTPAFASNMEGGWEQTKNMEGHDLSSVKIYMSTSSASDPDNYKYVQEKLFPKAHMCEYSGGTEGVGFMTNKPYSQSEPSIFDSITFGTKLHFIKDRNDHELVTMYIVVSNKDGYIPPMGLSKSLLNKDKDHNEEYFTIEEKDIGGKILSKGPKFNDKGEALRKHGDSLTLFSKGFIGDITSIDGLRFRSAGREDDIINVKGNKIGADNLEALIRANIKGKISEDIVQDFSVFQLEPKFGNKVIYNIILKDKNINNPKDTITKEFRDAIKKYNSLFAVIDDMVFVDSLAKSGSKVQRKAMRNIYQNTINQNKPLILI